jgi:HlyD family secretion protein
MKESPMRTGSKAKRRNIYIIAAAVVIVLFFVIRPMLGPKDEPVIRTAKVERGTVTASVSATGTLQPLTTVEVKSNVAGSIVKLAVDEGDTVKAGQLIARIDPSDTQTAFEQTQADLAAATSKVDQARQQLLMQHQQDFGQIAASRQALAAARTRLLQAQEQAKVQPTLTKAAINQARSNYAAAQSALSQTRSALTPQKIASAQAAFDQAQANYNSAEKDFARQKQLLAKGFVSQSQVDVSEASYSSAKAQLDTARSKLATIKNETDQDLSSAQARADQAKAALDNALANKVQDQVKAQEAIAAQAAVQQAQASLQVALASTRQDRIKTGDIVQANAQVKRSQASFQNARTQLGYTTVMAPRAGIVTKKYVEEGSIVTAGRSSFAGSGAGVAIVDIADTSRMFAMVGVDETDIAQIEVGQEVDVTVEAYPDELFTGKVTKIAPQSVTDQNVTTIPVTVEIELPDARLKPGMNVNCDFITARAEDVLMVPSEAVKEADDGNSVIVLDHGEQVTRKVETGIVGGDNTEIKKGLKVGEVVVTAVVQPTTTTGLTPSGTGGGAGRIGGMGGMGGGGGGRRGF